MLHLNLAISYTFKRGLGIIFDHYSESVMHWIHSWVIKYCAFESHFTPVPVIQILLFAISAKLRGSVRDGDDVFGAGPRL